jgi:hypothetical protein
VKKSIGLITLTAVLIVVIAPVLFSRLNPSGRGNRLFREDALQAIKEFIGDQD